MSTDVPPGDQKQHERERWVQRSECEIFALQVKVCLLEGVQKKAWPCYCPSFSTPLLSKEAFHYLGPSMAIHRQKVG